MIEVKKFPAERWRETRDLRLESLKTEPTAFGSAYEEEVNFTEAEWQRRTGSLLMAVSEDDRPVGTITYVFGDRVKTRHVAHIHGFYVSPDYRGQGVGRKLLERALEEIGKNKSAVKIQLTVNTKREAALALYKSMGFAVVGEMKKELIVGDEYCDEYIMEMFL